MVLRIRGLVRAQNILRDRLQRGIPPQEQDHFRAEVQNLLQTVEELCADHQTSPDQLPKPSRNAYRYLKRIDLDTLPAPQQQHTIHTKVRIPKLVKTGHHFASRLWDDLDLLQQDTEACRALRIELAAHATQVETLCEQEGQTPAALERPSQQIYTWLCYLSREDNLQAHLEALAMARQLAQKILDLSKPLRVELIAMHSLWRMRELEDEMLLRCSQGFAHADRRVWQAILTNAFIRSNTHHRHVVRAYADSETFQTIQLDLASFLPLSDHEAAGHTHHLGESFQRVNQTFFRGRFSQPQLIWSRAANTQTFGHYLASHDQIMISSSLDHPEVPDYVVDFVMYHEILHKKHGVQYQNGRRVVHTQAFRREERAFPRYRAAEDFLARWARKLRRG